MKYITRNIDKTIVKLLETFRVIGITGPRQSGKTSTVKNNLKEQYQYISFDNMNNLDEFHFNPENFMRKYNKYIIFDEVQNVPEIFNYIKIIIDNEPEIKGRFVLTGSGQFSFNKNISESLAGRIAIINLLPFDFSEVRTFIEPDSEFFGSYPEIVINKFQNSEIWFDSYVKTYLERDVRLLTNVGDLRDFQRFMILISGYVSKQLNMSEISKQTGVSVNTVKRWLSILEASYVIFFLNPFYKNFNKRITKTPKLYFFDTGLASYLMGVYGRPLPESGSLKGQLFENYIISEIKKRIYHNFLQDRIYFYRTSGGSEIDLIIESSDSLSLAEIKLSSKFNPVFFDVMNRFPAVAKNKYVIYSGITTSVSDNSSFVNYKDFLVRDKVTGLKRN